MRAGNILRKQFHDISILVCLLVLLPSVQMIAAELTPVEQLGKKLFFDTKLSTNGMQSCATCYAPEVDPNRATLDMFPRPQVDNIVIFLKTLSDGFFER